MSKSKPNIILIVSDQHRGDWMGCAGNGIVHTPNLDRMAQGGVRFTNAYCNSPLCVPSRMSMITGRYPHHTGVFDNNGHLASDIPTFAHALGIGGYETVLCGRMHFVGPDQRHGYGQRLVGDITHSYPGGPSTAYGELSMTAQQGLVSIQKAGPGTSPVLQFDQEVIASFEQFLDNRESAAERPLFITVGLYGPHHPYTCPQDYYERALAAMELEGDAPIHKQEGESHPWMKDWFSRLQADEITPEQAKVARACYAGLVSLTDSYMGRVLKSAESLEGETIVIYLSDHGDMAGDRGMFWKRSPFEGSIRVPMIYYSLSKEGKQNTIAVGREINAPVTLVDLAPTLSQLADSPYLPRVDGRDLSPLLQANLDNDLSDWDNRPVFSELANEQDSAIRLVIRNGIKLIYFHGYEAIMYDLNLDPKEQQDISLHPDYSEVKQELLGLLLHGWKPEAILSEISDKKKDLQILSQWGKAVGMGRLDLWKH